MANQKESRCVPGVFDTVFDLVAHKSRCKDSKYSWLKSLLVGASFADD